MDGSYMERNYNFLIPVYEKLYKDIGTKIYITLGYKKNIRSLQKYFLYLDKIKKRNKIKFNKTNKKEQTDNFISLINANEIDKAVDSLENIIHFLNENRSNINGLEVIAWSLFGKTSLNDIKDFFINDTNNKENVKNALLGFGFNALFIEYSKFTNVFISDLLIPVELISPKRRQGLFDKEVFNLISIEIKKFLKNFKFEAEINELDIKYLKNSTNWLVTEKTTKKIKFPLPSNSKKVDMLCKVANSLFIGTHKEQQAGGGAQDNQAVDAGFLFNYTKDELTQIKNIFSVNEVFLCIFLERGKARLTSSHWGRVIDIVSSKTNDNKYLLSSVQFIDLIKSKFV